MDRIRCGSGLGDSLYLQSVARHLVERGAQLQVCTDYPEIFRNLDVSIAPFSRENIDIHAVYTLRKREATDQFQDCCIQAGITEPVDLRLDWEPDWQFDTDKPVVLLQLPRSPMNRTDGFGSELLPDCSVIQRIIDSLDAYIVQVGSGEALYKFTGVHLDLTNKTTLTELLDVAAKADAFIGYPSFFIPLAESFSKPALFVWSRKGLRSKEGYVRQITPQKILHRQSSRYVIDDEQPPGNIFEQKGSGPRIPWPERGDSGKRSGRTAKRSRFRRRTRHRS